MKRVSPLPRTVRRAMSCLPSHSDNANRLAPKTGGPQAVAPPDGDGAGQRAEKHVAGQLGRGAAGCARNHGDHGRHHHGDPAVEQDGQEQAHRRHRDEERKQRPPDRQLDGQGGDDEHEPHQEERVVPVPVGRPEAPDPGEQQAHHQQRQQEPPAELGDVRARIEEAESGHDLDVKVGDAMAGVDDDLALLDGDADRLDCGSSLLPGRLGGGRVVGGVRHEQGRENLADERPLVGRQSLVGKLGDRSPRGLEGRVADLAALRRFEHAARLGAQFQPAGPIEVLEPIEGRLR